MTSRTQLNKVGSYKISIMKNLTLSQLNSVLGGAGGNSGNEEATGVYTQITETLSA